MSNNYGDGSNTNIVESRTNRRGFLKGLSAATVASFLGSTGIGSVGADVSTDGEGEPVIYQYFHTEWSDIEEHVDLLAEAGVTAVWLPQPAISKLDWQHTAFQGEEGFYEGQESPYGGRDPHPPVGYQPVDLRDFDGSFGTEDELDSLIDTLHEHDIDVVLDAVLNHMANQDAPQDPWGGELDWPQFETQEHFTSVPYDNYEGEIRDPQYDQPLLSLPNLDNLHPEVQRAHVDYIQKLADLGADGVRFDAIKHVWPSHLEEDIVPILNDNDMFSVGEYWDEGNVGELLEFADVGIDVFDFPLYSSLKNAIESNDLSQIQAGQSNGVVHSDPTAAVTFAQNHDTVGPGVQPDQQEGHLVDLAYAFILSYPGTTHLYRSGVRQDGPWDLENPEIRDLIWVKTHLADGELIERHTGSQTYIYERNGSLLAGISVASGDQTQTVETSWTNETLVDATGHGADVQTDADGRVEITVPAEGWVMYGPESLVEDPQASGFSVTIDAVHDDGVEAGDDVGVDVTVENNGDESGSQDVVLSVGGDEVDSISVSLAAGDSRTVTLTYGNAADGDHSATVSSDDDVATDTIQVGGGESGVTLTVDAPTADGESVYFTGSTDALTNWGGGVEGTNADGDTWTVTVEDADSFEWKTRRGPSGGSGDVWENGNNHGDGNLSPSHQGWADGFEGGPQEITLSIDAPTQWGESVYFTGSTDALTNWGGGVEGTYTDGAWEVTIEDPGDFEWKTRLGPSGDSGNTWESGDNHDESDLSPTHQGWE